MLMEMKGGLGSGALGPNIDPNPDVPLKRIIKIKQTSVPEPLYMLVNRVTGAKTGESIVMELERGTCSPRSRTTCCSTRQTERGGSTYSPGSADASQWQAKSRDTSSEGRGTWSPPWTSTRCSTTATTGGGSTYSTGPVVASQEQVGGSDTRSEGRGTGSPSSTATRCSTTPTTGGGSPLWLG